MSDEIEKVNVIVISESPRAFHLRDGDNPERTEWFPKSQVSFAQRNVHTGVGICEIPQWLLKAKGWDS